MDPPTSLLRQSSCARNGLFNIELNIHLSRNKNDPATRRLLCIGHLGHDRGTFQSLWWEHLATGLASVVKEIAREFFLMALGPKGHPQHGC